MSDRRIGLPSPHERPHAQLVIRRGCLKPLSLRLSVHVHAEFYVFTDHKVCYVTCMKGRMSYFLMTVGLYKHVRCFVIFVFVLSIVQECRLRVKYKTILVYWYSCIVFMYNWTKNCSSLFHWHLPFGMKQHETIM